MRTLPTSAAPPIVFIVDDDVSVRDSLELLVRNDNWKPQTFASAQEFLNYPRTLVPSCLVLDLSLPGLNGLELQKQLAVEHSDMPIIFITGYGDVPKSVQAMKAGAFEFLTKPLNSDALVSAIRKRPPTKPSRLRSTRGDAGASGPLRLTYSPRTAGDGVGCLWATE
jgi:FixJ family two-component response regulator